MSSLKAITAPRILGVTNVVALICWVAPAFLAGVIGIIVAATTQYKDPLKFVIPLLIDSIITCFSVSCAFGLWFWTKRPLAIVYIVFETLDLIVKCVLMIYFGVAYALSFADRTVCIIFLFVIGFTIVIRLIFCGFSLWFLKKPQSQIERLESAVASI